MYRKQNVLIQMCIKLTHELSCLAEHFQLTVAVLIEKWQNNDSFWFKSPLFVTLMLSDN